MSETARYPDPCSWCLRWHPVGTTCATPGPYKCPDCGTWWAGWEHRCEATSLGADPWYCSVCSAWHPFASRCPLVTSSEVERE